VIVCYPEGEDADRRLCRRVHKEVLQNCNCLADFVTDLGVLCITSRGKGTERCVCSCNCYPSKEAIV
jgi:hypothetical protein